MQKWMAGVSLSECWSPHCLCFIESLDELSAEPALTLSHLCVDLSPEDLLTPSLLMCDLSKVSLCIQCFLSVRSFKDYPDLNSVSLPYYVLWYSNHVLQTGQRVCISW